MPITRSKFDVALFMRDKGSDVTEDWLYSTELFDRSTIVRMAKHFENLLRHAVSQPEARLSALDMLSEEEKQQREKERTENKLSQRKKLISAAPKAVNLAGASRETKG
jgi:non-ribosomal peptide synthetase component F